MSDTSIVLLVKQIINQESKFAKKLMMVINSQDENCPIFLENITFSIISDYLV